MVSRAIRGYYLGYWIPVGVSHLGVPMLTDSKLKSLKPADKAYKVADAKGLHLLVKPNGSMLWRVKYRWQRREQLASLGAYPEVGLKEARERRGEIRAQLRRGEKPNTSKRSADADTFEGIAREWIAGGCPGGKAVSASTVEQAKTRLETHAYKQIGNRRLEEIQVPDILSVLRRLENGGKHEMAHRVMSLISRVYRFAIATGRATTDPTRDLRGALKPVPTRNRSALTDPKAVGTMLKAIDSYSGQAVTRAALQLLALTFVRPVELRLAVWGEFTLEGKEPQWVIPAERMKMKKEHVVPLAPQAVEILTELAKLTDKGSDSLVFPSLRPNRPLSENTLNMALRNMGFDGSQHTSHGFRSTASTLLHELGCAPETIETQLAHARPGVAAVYNRSHLLPQRRKLMADWATYLDGLRAGNVVPIGAKHGAA